MPNLGLLITGLALPIYLYPTCVLEYNIVKENFFFLPFFLLIIIILVLFLILPSPHPPHPLSLPSPPSPPPPLHHPLIHHPLPSLSLPLSAFALLTGFSLFASPFSNLEPFGWK